MTHGPGDATAALPPDTRDVASEVGPSYAFGPFRIDPGAHQLFRDEEPITLGVKAFDTLVALVRHRQRVVTKDELIKLIWPDSFVSEDSLTHTISAVRRALGDDPAQPRFVLTVARRGYRFIAQVSESGQQVSDQPTVAAAPSPDRATALPPPSIANRSSHHPWLLVAAGAVVAALLVFATQAAVRSRGTSQTPVGTLRFTQELPPGTTLASGGVLSPDSRYLAFVARDDQSGRTQLWLRALDSADARVLDGTDGATRPFWSPDSQYLGYFAGSRVMRVGANGGVPQSVTTTLGTRPSGGTWSPSGVILYSDSAELFTVPASGGVATRLRELNQREQEVSLRLPQFLPDGRHYLYSAVSANPIAGGTYVASLDSPGQARVLDAETSSVTYVPGGYLVGVRDHVLVAQPFDQTTFKPIGKAEALAGNVSPNIAISASAGGLLSFGGGVTTEALTWFDRTGNRVSTLSGAAPLNNIALSPDDQRLVGSGIDPNQLGLWLVDLRRGAPTRLVTDGGGGVWSPDGTKVAFTALRSPGRRGIYTREAAGRNDDVLLLATDEPKVVNDWSRDGRYIVYIAADAQTRQDVWLLPQFGAAGPQPFLKSPANEIQVQVSPDGRWIAYASDESGTWEVYVQSFPVAGAKQTISIGGGCQPQWRADGRELYYLSLNHTLMSVDISADAELHAGKPMTLFRASVLGALTDYRNLYAAARDGSRFLVKTVAPGNQDPITVLYNWNRSN